MFTKIQIIVMLFVKKGWRIMTILVVLSVLLNLLIIALGAFIIYKKGGFLFLKSKISSASRYSYYSDKKSFFENVGTKNVDIAFVGDSMIDNGEWCELFPQSTVANRGIGGDTTSGVLNRLSSLQQLNPSKIFILVGINDIIQNVNQNTILANYRQIVKEIKNILPNTEFYIGNLLNVNNEMFRDYFFKNPFEINGKVDSINSQLKVLSKEENVTFLDISSGVTENRQLIKQFTLDGLHLNANGYLKLSTHLQETLGVKVNNLKAQ